MMESLRHNQPALYVVIKFFMYLSLTCVVCYGTWHSFQAVSPKAKLLTEAVYWETRAFLYDGHDNKNVRPVKHFTAEILGMTKEAKVVFKMSTPEGSKNVHAELADLIITDIESTSKILNRFRGQIIYVDYYQYQLDGVVHNCVVLWDEFESPLNLELVERQFASPIENPPTNIVNSLMAGYYWRKLKE
jgi:hypothetical protein